MSAVATAASVVLTRPHGKNESLACRLVAAGLSTQILPALHIVSLPHPKTVPLPDDYDLIVFVSGNALWRYFELFSAQVTEAYWPARTLAATVGVSSAQALYDRDWISRTQIMHPDVDERQDSESLWRMLAPALSTMRRALIVRGSTGRDWLGLRLEEAGVQVERLALYERQPAQWTAQQAAQLTEALSTGRTCVFLLTSGESVDAVYANVTRLGLDVLWRQARFVVVHERVASRLQSILKASGKVGTPVVKICQPNDDAIFKTITQMASLSESS